MLYLNPKYLILQTFPEYVGWHPPFRPLPETIIASADRTTLTAKFFASKSWGERSPELLFTLTKLTGVLSYCGWVAKKSALRGPPLDDHQREALLNLFRALKAGNGVLGDSFGPHELAAWQAGAALAVDGKPADPYWLPQPDPVWLDTALMGANPWDGWAAWSAKHGRAAVASDPVGGAGSPEPSSLTKTKPAKATGRRTATTKERRTSGPDIFGSAD